MACKHSWRHEMTYPLIGARDCCVHCWARRYRRGITSIIEDTDGWHSSLPTWLARIYPKYRSRKPLRWWINCFDPRSEGIAGYNCK